MVKCKYCNNNSAHYAANPYNGELVNVCEWHYSKWRPNLSKDVSDWKKCVLCKTRSKRLIKHHVSYFPEYVIAVCNSCHLRIHSVSFGKFRPPEGDCDLFYS